MQMLQDDPGPMESPPTPPPPPVLIELPKDSYVVRGRHQQNSAVLTCKALYVQRIRFKCQGFWVPDEWLEVREGVDSRTGTAFMQTTLPVGRHLMDRVRSPREDSAYTCECYAFASGTGAEDSTLWVKSPPATVRLAYLLKDFIREPASERRPLGSLVELPCLAPEGEPPPEIFWLKDGVEIISRKDPNVILANDGSLLISSARISDSGNYTCGARNVVLERLTEPASVHIYVNGQWSEWGPWEGVCPTSCDVFVGSHRRTEAKLTRYRHCNNPAPSNGGVPCPGASKERLDCNLPCPVDGQWSDWSRWSDCLADCRRHRRRQCDNPSPRNGGLPCAGAERQWRNCSEHLCPPGGRQSAGSLESDGLMSGGGANLTMYAGLGAAVFAFLLALALVFAVMVRRRGCRRCGKDYERSATAVPVRSLLVNRQPPPGATLPEDIGRLTIGHSVQPYSHGFEPPATLESNRSRRGLIAWSQKTTSSAMYYPSTSEDNNYATVDDSRVDYQYSEDRVSLMSSNPSRYTSSPNVTRSNPNGRCILLKKHAVSLFIPEGAMNDSDLADIALTVCEDEYPPLADWQTPLTPVLWVRCNTTAVLKKPAVLSMEHGAFLPAVNGSPPCLNDWSISCLVGEEVPYDMASGDWNVAATVGKETLNTDVYCQIESRMAHVLLESFGRLVLVGEPKIPAVGRALKRTRLLAFFGDHCLRVYCSADTRTALNWVAAQESHLGGRLCALGADIFHMQLTMDLCVRLESISAGWQLMCRSLEQQIPAAHLRTACPQALHCSFALDLNSPDHLPSMDPGALKARIHVYQTSLADAAVLDVDTEAWWDITDCFCVFFPAIRLPHSVKQRLAELLDPPLDMANDWRMLAQLLCVDHYLPFFASRPSPTELILTLWESREPNIHGFVKLMHFLRRMKRQDACAVLNGYLNNL